jgi:hypothetical protein
MPARVVPVFQYYPVYNDTVQGFYLHGFGDDQGIAFITTVNANFPGIPPGASLELGEVNRHVDGTIARTFTIRGYATSDQSAPWGIVVVYGLLAE